MICVVQRVLEAKVVVADEVVGQIGPGMLVLASIERDDTDREIKWMAEKLVSMRIFRNEQKHFDRDAREIGGGILLISNFTVAADTRKGRRPSLDRAADPARGAKLFGEFVEAVNALGVTVATGKFGADMKVHLVNDGPATFIVQTDPG